MPFDVFAPAAMTVAKRRIRKTVRPDRASFFPGAGSGEAPPAGAMMIGGSAPPEGFEYGTEDWNRGRGGRQYGSDTRGEGKWGGGRGGGVYDAPRQDIPRGGGGSYLPPVVDYQAGDEQTGAGTESLLPAAEAPQDVYDWLHSIISGEGESFDPIRDALRAQEDAARRRMAEMYASRGMAASGALAGGLAGITQDFARKQAEAYMNWRQQQVQNKFGAAQMLFQDYWKNLGFEQQKALAELMFELDRKAKYGSDYNPELGDYELQILRDLMASDSLSNQGKRLVKKLLVELGYGGIF